MKDKKHKIPQKLVMGGHRTTSQEAKVPTGTSPKGRIGSNMNIRWTPRKKTIAAAVLGIPFLLSTFIALKSGYLFSRNTFNWSGSFCRANVSGFALYR